jgi:hypothetical protein
MAASPPPGRREFPATLGGRTSLNALQEVAVSMPGGSKWRWHLVPTFPSNPAWSRHSLAAHR